jgi:hypothetical protein
MATARRSTTTAGRGVDGGTTTAARTTATRTTATPIAGQRSIMDIRALERISYY